MFSGKLTGALLQICNIKHRSYKTAAERCDIRSRRFGSIVRKESSPVLTVLEKTCKALHVTPNGLLGYPYPADLRFREKLAVISVRFSSSSELTVIYPVCPRCHLPIPREFQNYCSNCGQALSWDEFYIENDD